jgi:flagellar basal-body rod protein FlgB
MKVNMFDTVQTSLMKKALDVYGKKHNAIAKNVAHADDPDYQPERVDFSRVLQAEIGSSNIKTTDAKHIAGSRFSGLDMRPDTTEKPVDIGAEMTALAENQIRYEFVSRALGQYYEKIKMAITAGKM